MNDFLTQACGWTVLVALSAVTVAVVGFTMKMYYVLFMLGWHLV